MKSKYNTVNWLNIQNDYNKGMTLIEIYKKYSISRTIIVKAIKNGLFIKDPTRRYGHKHTQETKKLLSIKQKNYLKNNPDKHVWKKQSKFKSAPCEKLKEILKLKGISFVEEFQPSNQYNYSIDIAFPIDKIGIEINGNQHYNNDGTLKDYYKKREEYLQNLGWKIYQIHYSLIYNNIINIIINSILEKINIIDYSHYIFKNLKKCIICNKKLKKDSKIDKCKSCIAKEKNLRKIEERIQLILSSNIDFSKFGWVQKLSLILNIQPQHVSTWMKKHMNSFYEEKCFKKKYKK